MAKGLTDKQAMFIKEYLIDLNATQAAIRAGYSEHTAHATGQENLRKPIIAEAVAKAKAERGSRLDIDADWVLKKAVELVQQFQGESNSAAVSALNLVAKHRDVDAMASDKQTLQNPDGTGLYEGIAIEVVRAGGDPKPTDT